MLWCGGCAVPSGLKGYRSLSTNEKILADSILLHALDHEALYTLLDSIKPISSVKMVRYPIAPDSTHKPVTVSQIKNPLYIDSLDIFYRLNDKLSGAEVAFVAIPFKASDKEYKNVQMYAVRRSSLQRVITEQSSFFGQFGITKNTPAQTVINIIEGTQAYERWRGYGYLFGYPNHAVDFFVQAGISQDSTGKFVERKFFHMPVFAGNSGHFTYALPKDYTPGNIDSALYHKANNKLMQYKLDREKWMGQKKLKTVKILRKIDSGRF
jgi:hypothetical protein